MKLCLFTKQSYFDGRIIQAGEELLVPDDTAFGSHMVDVATGKSGAEATVTPVAVFRPDLAHAPAAPPAAQTPAAARASAPVAPSSAMTTSRPTTPPLSPDEARVKATEEAIARAEATRKAEAAAQAPKTSAPGTKPAAS